jgi:Lysozyme like domain
MTTLSSTTATQYAQQAGFSGQSLTTVLAIANAESGLNPLAKNCNNPGGTCDRGILQINNYWHPEVSDACAYNPLCAFQQAFRISNNGRDFTPWTTYTNGTYKQFLGNTSNSSILPSGSSSSGSTWQSSIVSFGEHIALFFIALVLIVLGFVLMGEKHAIELASKVPVL